MTSRNFCGTDVVGAAVRDDWMRDKSKSCIVICRTRDRQQSTALMHIARWHDYSDFSALASSCCCSRHISANAPFNSINSRKVPRSQM